MKRILSLVLAMVMVLGSFSAVFAAEQTAAEKAGAFLQSVDVLRGNASGDLKLQDDLKRRDAVVLLSRLMDQEAEAEAFPSKDLKFDDITDAYYNGFVAWAVSNGIVNGKSATKFDPNGDLEARDFATMLLRALGHEVTGDAYTVALETAKGLGLLEDVAVENETTVTRGTMAVMTFNALGTPMKDSTTTLADKLEIEMPAPEVSTDIEITSAVAIANNKVEVKVKEEVAASKADFAIVKKGTTTAVEVKDVVKESAKVFIVETEALVGGTSYTVTSNGKTINFTGLAADTTAPTVVKVSATDTNTFVVEYSDRMDNASATNVENYTFNKDIKAVKATLNADRTKVTLTTDAAKRNIVYTLTIQGVTNSDGKVIAKVTRTITAVEDRIAPKLTRFEVQNNRMLVVKFEDANGMNKVALEAAENYSINDLGIVSATAYDTNLDGKYETVVLMTEDQVVNKAYTLTINNLVDNSVLANALGKTTRTFRGMAVDKVAPTVKVGSIVSENNNLVDIEFNEHNAMDIESVEDISNYVITYGNNEVLPVLEAEIWYTSYPDAYAAKGVTLTTAQQDKGRSYKIEVKGVKDEFGNELKPLSGSNYAKYNFVGSNVDTQPPFVNKVEYVNSTTVKLLFNERVAKATDPTSYVINKGIGSAIKAVVTPGTQGKGITLTTQALSDNTSYTITINNVEDRFGNALANVNASFVATASTLDVIAPTITYMYAPNKDEVHINFDEGLDFINRANATSTFTLRSNGTNPHTVTLSYLGMIEDGTTLVYRTSASLKAETYEVIGFTSANEIKDYAGNKFIIPNVTVNNVTTPDYNVIPELSGNTGENVPARVEYIEQVNVGKIKVRFDKPVEGLTGEGLTVVTMNRNVTDDTHSTEWYYTKTPIFAAGTTLKLNFTAIAKDLLGLGVWDEADTKNNDNVNKTSWTPYLSDETKPTMVFAESTRRDRVTVTYDEDLKTTSSQSYSIYRLDDNNRKVWVVQNAPGTVITTAVNKVSITIPAGKELSSQYIYFIEPVVGATDLAGNREDVRGVVHEFPGTDVTVDGFVTGVSIYNAKSIGISSTEKRIVSVAVYENSVSGIEIGSVPNVNAFSASISLKAPVLSGVKYVAKVTFADGTQDYAFDGITPNLGFEISKQDATNYFLHFGGYVAGEFYYEILDATGNKISGNPNVVLAADNKVAITGLNVGDDVYVVLYDKDNAGTVVYAGKTSVVIAANATPAQVNALVAEVVTAKITSLSVTPTTDAEIAAVQEAREAFNVLTAAQKALVNEQPLLDAEAFIAQP